MFVIECRYCGRTPVTARLAVQSVGRKGHSSEARCPDDGHRLPPAPPDCLACAGACLACDSEEAVLPCPRCGRTIVPQIARR